MFLYADVLLTSTSSIITSRADIWHSSTNFCHVLEWKYESRLMKSDVFSIHGKPVINSPIRHQAMSIGPLGINLSEV